MQMRLQVVLASYACCVQETSCATLASCNDGVPGDALVVESLLLADIGCKGVCVLNLTKCHDGGFTSTFSPSMDSL